MKRLLVLLLGLLLLASCGPIAREATELVTTTAGQSPTEFVPTVPLPTDPPLTQAPGGAPAKLALSDAITVFPRLRGGTGLYEIWMRGASGEEARLLEIREGSAGELLLPALLGQVSDRYFAFEYGVLDTDAFTESRFYDVTLRRVVEVRQPPQHKLMFAQARDGKVYLRDVWEEDIGDDGALYWFGISALDGGGPVAAQEQEANG